MKIERVFDILYHQLAHHPRSNCLAAKSNQYWNALPTQEVVNLVNRFSLGLMTIGIQPGDKVAIIADNCVEWILTDIALQQVGAISVPLYPTVAQEDARYILHHAEVKLAFAGTKALHKKLLDAELACPIYVYDNKQAPHWSDIIDQADSLHSEALEARKQAIQAEDLYTIIYTSGTTGRSKGVMLSHKNVVSTVISTAHFTNLPYGQCRALSTLPLSHIFERASLYYYLYCSAAIYLSNVESLSIDLKEVRPHTFSAVPRVLEKIHDRLTSKTRGLRGLKRVIYQWALQRAEQFEPSTPKSHRERLQHYIADRLVYRHWRTALGETLRWVNVGSAALQPRLARLFWACGIAVAEGYGMTETSPVITANPFSAKDVRIGSVGIPLPGVQIRLAEDGEILVSGDNVMMGYYKEPQLTAETLQEGWLHTGDIGVIEQGYLRITDRKKEMFKISNGKYIAPQVLENKLKESSFIDQIMVVGDGQKYPAALIVPFFDKLREWCAEHGIPYTTNLEMSSHPSVISLMDREIKRFNRYFGRWEHIKKFVLLDQPWRVDSGELAPTLKLRRKIISSHCQRMIDHLYGKT